MLGSDASSATLATASSSGDGQINSNSVHVALLDSHYTELAELVEKALLLPSLEAAVCLSKTASMSSCRRSGERGVRVSSRRRPGERAPDQRRYSRGAVAVGATDNKADRIVTAAIGALVK
ncbi:hypothetical protein Cni_G08428 [Canna indica]|uniref:Uncharacterized protein n=1 Tax=Canna indica TaxID=4628 RepID=A0AAQ3K472_9LILI|nr:hypothetical protein Cni_G08428 [Canna indica]